MAINECILRPGICGEGQCVDTPEAYECICKPGYHQKGHSQVCEGQCSLLNKTNDANINSAAPELLV